MEGKIRWKKPDYKNKWSKVSEKEINECCLNGTQTGDIRTEKETRGRKITFSVFRLEKEGELIRGLETLHRDKLIEECRDLEKKVKMLKKLTKRRGK